MEQDYNIIIEHLPNFDAINQQANQKYGRIVKVSIFLVQPIVLLVYKNKRYDYECEVQ